MSLVVNEPVGVVGAVVAWNSNFISFMEIRPALAAGNTQWLFNHLLQRLYH